MEKITSTPGSRADFLKLSALGLLGGYIAFREYLGYTEAEKYGPQKLDSTIEEVAMEHSIVHTSNGAIHVFYSYDHSQPQETSDFPENAFGVYLEGGRTAEYTYSLLNYPQYVPIKDFCQKTGATIFSGDLEIDTGAQGLANAFQSAQFVAASAIIICSLLTEADTVVEAIVGNSENPNVVKSGMDLLASLLIGAGLFSPTLGAQLRAHGVDMGADLNKFTEFVIGKYLLTARNMINAYKIRTIQSMLATNNNIGPMVTIWGSAHRGIEEYLAMDQSELLKHIQSMVKDILSIAPKTGFAISAVGYCSATSQECSTMTISSLRYVVESAKRGEN